MKAAGLKPPCLYCIARLFLLIGIIFVLPFSIKANGGDRDSLNRPLEARNFEVVQQKLQKQNPELTEGLVFIRVWANEEGLYQKHEILASTDHKLSQMCTAYLTDIQFQPALANGIRTKGKTDLRFEFQKAAYVPLPMLTAVSKIEVTEKSIRNPYLSHTSPGWKAISTALRSDGMDINILSIEQRFEASERIAFELSNPSLPNWKAPVHKLPVQGIETDLQMVQLDQKTETNKSMISAKGLKPEYQAPIRDLPYHSLEVSDLKPLEQSIPEIGAAVLWSIAAPPSPPFQTLSKLPYHSIETDPLKGLVHKDITGDVQPSHSFLELKENQPAYVAPVEQLPYHSPDFKDLAPLEKPIYEIGSALLWAVASPPSPAFQSLSSLPYHALETDSIHGLAKQAITEQQNSLEISAPDAPSSQKPRSLPYHPLELEDLNQVNRTTQTVSIESPDPNMRSTIPSGPAAPPLKYEPLDEDVVRTVNTKADVDVSISAHLAQPEVSLLAQPKALPKIEAGDETAEKTEVISFAHFQPVLKPQNLGEVVQLISYPDAAKQEGVEGLVQFRLKINKEGQYEQHLVLGEIPYLTEACEPLLNQLKYAPLIKSGEAVSFWANVSFRFDLKLGGPAVFYQQEMVVTDNDFSH